MRHQLLFIQVKWQKNSRKDKIFIENRFKNFTDRDKLRILFCTERLYFTHKRDIAVMECIQTVSGDFPVNYVGGSFDFQVSLHS